LRKTTKKDRDLRFLEAFLNFDFASSYRRLSKENVPSAALRYFLDRCKLNSRRGWKKAGEIQRELCEAIFPDYHPKRISKPYIEELIPYFNRFVRNVQWDTEKENGATKLVVMHELSASAWEYLTWRIASRLINRRTWEPKHCEHCQRIFFGKEKYCSPMCLKDRHKKMTSNRVLNTRANNRLEEIRPQIVKLKEMEKKVGRKKLETYVPDLNRELLDEIIRGKKDLKDLSREIKYKNRRVILEADLSEPRPRPLD